MLIDREVVLGELRRRIADGKAVVENSNDEFVTQCIVRQLEDFRTWIESLPPPPSPVGAEVSALVKEARSYTKVEVVAHKGMLFYMVDRLADAIEAQEKKLAHVLELNAKLSDENEHLEGSVHYRAVRDLEKKLADADERYAALLEKQEQAFAARILAQQEVYEKKLALAREMLALSIDFTCCGGSDGNRDTGITEHTADCVARKALEDLK